MVAEMTSRKMWGNGPCCEDRKRKRMEAKRIKLMRERREGCRMGKWGGKICLYELIVKTCRCTVHMKVVLQFHEKLI